MLPVDAHTAILAPASTAFDIATVIPRSLNEPVGLAPSNFRYTSHPVASDRLADLTRGVPPSPSVTIGVESSTGSQGRYSSMTPRHGRGRVGLGGPVTGPDAPRATGP